MQRAKELRVQATELVATSSPTVARSHRLLIEGDALRRELKRARAQTPRVRRRF